MPPAVTGHEQDAASPLTEGRRSSDTSLGPSPRSVPEQLCDVNGPLSPTPHLVYTTVAFPAPTPGGGGISCQLGDRGVLPRRARHGPHSARLSEQEPLLKILQLEFWGHADGRPTTTRGGASSSRGARRTAHLQEQLEVASQPRHGLAQLVSEAGRADAAGPARGQHHQLPEGAREPDGVRLGLAVGEHFGRRRRRVSGRGPRRGRAGGHVHTHGHTNTHAHMCTRTHMHTHGHTNTHEHTRTHVQTHPHTHGHAPPAASAAREAARAESACLRPSGLSSSWASWARATAHSAARTRRKPRSRPSAALSAPRPLASAAADQPISSLQTPGRTGSAAPGHRAPAVPAEPGRAETAASVPPPARRPA